MIEFEREMLDWFIGVVRKYMHLRGDLSQKDLAEEINVGISTLSRFLNQKTKELDEQLVAKIVAFLDIPLHEIIDFIEEDSTVKFKKLIAFYREDTVMTELMSAPQGDEKSEAKKRTSVRIGRTKVSFGHSDIPVNDQNLPLSKIAQKGEESLSDKFAKLSPRQKAYLSDFLDLDSDARDLIVDIGNQLLRYFKQKRLSF